MACKFICDGCGKEEPAEHNGHDWFKPSSWYERSDKDGIQTACSRECIEKIANHPKGNWVNNFEEKIEGLVEERDMWGQKLFEVTKEALEKGDKMEEQVKENTRLDPKKLDEHFTI